MAKYLDPERTLALAVLAVPDAVHAEVPEAHAEGWREGVLVVPYSLALPFVLSLYRLTVRFASAPDTEEVAARPRSALRSCCSGWTTRSRDGSPAPSSRRRNARDALRGDLAEARRTSGRLAGFDRPPAGG